MIVPMLHPELRDKAAVPAVLRNPSQDTRVAHGSGRWEPFHRAKSVAVDNRIPSCEKRYRVTGHQSFISALVARLTGPGENIVTDSFDAPGNCCGTFSDEGSGHFAPVREHFAVIVQKADSVRRDELPTAVPAKRRPQATIIPDDPQIAVDEAGQPGAIDRSLTGVIDHDNL
jgi:hypothetical protein